MTVLLLPDTITRTPSLRHPGLKFRTSGHSVSTWAPLGQIVTGPLAGVRSLWGKVESWKCTHPAHRSCWRPPPASASRWFSERVSRISRRGAASRTDPAHLVGCMQRLQPCTLVSQQVAGTSVLAQLQVLFGSYTCPEGGRPWPCACSGSSWGGPAVISIYQKLRSHKHTQTRPAPPGPQLGPLQPKEVGTPKSLAPTWNLSLQLPGATCCLTPRAAPGVPLS